MIAPPAGPGRRARAYTGEDSESFLVLQTLEKSLLEALSEAKATKGVPALVPEARVGDKSSLTVLQYTFPAGQPFVKDFALLTEGTSAGASGRPKRLEEYQKLVGEGYTKALQEKTKAFDRRFEQTFVAPARGVSKGMVPFGRYAFSALLGGMGYFTGRSLVKKGSEKAAPGPHGALYTAVPCRPFFPRGFMWDEARPLPPDPDPCPRELTPLGRGEGLPPASRVQLEPGSHHGCAFPLVPSQRPSPTHTHHLMPLHWGLGQV